MCRPSVTQEGLRCHIDYLGKSVVRRLDIFARSDQYVVDRPGVCAGCRSNAHRHSEGFFRGIIPNAQVAITDVATALHVPFRLVERDFTALPTCCPPPYEVRVTAMGFSTAVQKGIILTVGAQQELDFTMQVGQMTQNG